MTDGKDKPTPRTKVQIEADLAAARARLSGNLEDLIDQVHPNRVKQREVAKFKELAKAELDNAKSQFVTPNGKPRMERLAVIGGAVAGLVTFIVAIRLIVTRAKRRNSA